MAYVDLDQKFCLVVDGLTLEMIMDKQNSISELKEAFYRVAVKSSTVICCRVSPKQKGEIVALWKQKLP